MLEFYRETKRIAAKPHRCVKCGGTIIKAEQHIDTAGKYDALFFHGRYCVKCWDALKRQTQLRK